jgi:outer membrane protein
VSVAINGKKRIGTLALLLCAHGLHSETLTIGRAVEQALAKYPAVRASAEQVSAAEAGVVLARTAYLPRADFLGQINRATRNNVFGLLLPQSVIPSMSGPVLGTDNFTNVWGSAAGALLSWEPFDFGLRKANVDLAASRQQRSQAGLAVTEFQISTAAADSFLTLVAAGQAAAAARAGVERVRTIDEVTGALARSGLRPGADAARARAELALARTRLIQAEEAVEVARASLANLLAASPADIQADAGPLLSLPNDPTAAWGGAALAAHPLAGEQNAVVAEAKAQERTIGRTWYPRFLLQGSAYGRGTGARTDGTTGGPFSGFGPNVQNWAVGLTVSFPAFDFAAIRARRAAQGHEERAAEAQYQRVLQDLRGQSNRARAQLDGALRVAQNTPVELEAAREAEQQATARYQAGLGNIVEVAEAQRLLTEAEIGDSLARLDVWRSLLAIAAAQGDLKPFLDLAGK